MAKPSKFDMLVALNEANYLYKHAGYMERQQRLDSIVSLAEWGIFSVGHLAQISGWSTSTIAGFGISDKLAGAGRFNPRSLDTLIQLRINYNNKLPINLVLVKAALADGNSHRIVSRLSGIPLSTLNRKLNDKGISL